jgi:effector-binding domain-containing protein/uncharacterized protein YndB with AHSA1/START domain
MKILKIIGIVLLGIILLFLIIALFLPKEIKVEESILINAPVEKIFVMVNKTGNWDKWSPFAENKESTKVYYEGPSEGVGATIKWQENDDEDSKGQLKFVEVVPNNMISADLVFENSLKSKLNWYFETSQEGTLVIWNIVSKDLSYPFNRWMGLFAGRMIRPDFKKGLNNLKELCENDLHITKKWQTSEVRSTNIDTYYALTIKDSCISSNFKHKTMEIFNAINEYIAKNNIEQTSYPFCIFYSWNPEGVSVFEAGIPVSTKAKSSGRIIFSEIKGGKAVYASQYGPYESTSDAHDAIELYLKKNNLQINGYPWEVYITDTEKESDTTKWETQIFYPVK